MKDFILKYLPVKYYTYIFIKDIDIIRCHSVSIFEKYVYFYIKIK